MQREIISDKIMVVGVDGLDPRLSRHYIDAGKMPNLQKIVERGAQRKDLVLLGSQPTVTPPQWTTLATGANPVVHGICQFDRTIPGRINQRGYNLDSRNVKAEAAWNCLAEAGRKTLVFHWPGGAWPPTSASENLMVIDGSAPGSVGSSTMQVDGEMLVGASTAIKEVTFETKATDSAAAPCVIQRKTKAEKQMEAGDVSTMMRQAMNMNDDMLKQLQSAGVDTLYVMKDEDDGFGTRTGYGKNATVVSLSPIKEAVGWAAAPEGAKEFTILLSQGLLRRVGLILPNGSGIYDRVAIYRSKKDEMPLATCSLGKMVYNVIDDAIFDDQTYRSNRHYKLIDLAEDGSELRLYVSAAMELGSDVVIHPKRLHKAIIENVGPFPPQSALYTHDAVLQQTAIEVWDHVIDWYVKCFDYFIENEGVEYIFSHLHSVDLVEHTFIRFMNDLGFNKHDVSVYQAWMERLYQQVDRYFGALAHYIDEGWLMIITSDHAQVAPRYLPPRIGDMCGINVGLMQELGYTVLEQDEDGNDLAKIDWSKTRAIQSEGNDIYINLKGREPHGIVEPEDQYELEEQIMTDLYGYRHPDSGKRVIALALRNKDAVLLGYGGPTAGDICIWIAEGYNYDHTDGLSTTYGEANTSLSPIFVAAGKGVKQGYETERIIRQVDVAPTICYLAGVRMPAQCEGAPIYQIFSEEF